MIASSPAPAPVPTDPAAIQAAIAERQVRLAATVDELTARLQPKELARRAGTSAQRKARHLVVAGDGSLRVESLAGIAVALLAVGWLMVWRRGR